MNSGSFSGKTISIIEITNLSIYIPYMNTTTHGCDYEGLCKISTVL